MTIKPIFAWYDLWIGAFWDAAKRRLYVFPIPMLGLVIQFAAPKTRRRCEFCYGDVRGECLRVKRCVAGIAP